MALSDHCAVQLDEDRTLICGGLQYNSEDPMKSRHTWIYNWKSKSWVEVGPLEYPRISHSCSRIPGTVYNSL